MPHRLFRRKICLDAPRARKDTPPEAFVVSLRHRLFPPAVFSYITGFPKTGEIMAGSFRQLLFPIAEFAQNGGTVAPVALHFNPKAKIDLFAQKKLDILPRGDADLF